MVVSEEDSVTDDELSDNELSDNKKLAAKFAEKMLKPFLPTLNKLTALAERVALQKDDEKHHGNCNVILTPHSSSTGVYSCKLLLFG